MHKNMLYIEEILTFLDIENAINKDYNYWRPKNKW